MQTFFGSDGDMRGWPKGLALFWMLPDLTAEASEDGTEFALISDLGPEASAFVFGRDGEGWVARICDSRPDGWFEAQRERFDGDDTTTLKQSALRWTVGCRMVAGERLDWDRILLG